MFTNTELNRLKKYKLHYSQEVKTFNPEHKQDKLAKFLITNIWLFYFSVISETKREFSLLMLSVHTWTVACERENPLKGQELQKSLC